MYSLKKPNRSPYMTIDPRTTAAGFGPKGSLKNSPRDDRSDASDEGPVKESNPCVDLLCEKLADSKLDLQALYLNRCELQDTDAIEIVKSIFMSSNIKIRKLYFNNNSLTKQTAFQIAELLREGNTKLKEIGLKWNQIDGEGGAAIADALADNRDLKILDVSWNKLGVRQKDRKDPKSGKITVTQKEGEIGRAWGKALRDNGVLVHLDMSFNKICEIDTK